MLRTMGRVQLALNWGLCILAAALLTACKATAPAPRGLAELGEWRSCAERPYPNCLEYWIKADPTAPTIVANVAQDADPGDEILVASMLGVGARPTVAISIEYLGRDDNGLVLQRVDRWATRELIDAYGTEPRPERNPSARLRALETALGDTFFDAGKWKALRAPSPGWLPTWLAINFRNFCTLNLQLRVNGARLLVQPVI